MSIEERVFGEALVSDSMPEGIVEPGEVSLGDQPAYYRQLQKFPVLTRQEEGELARKLQQGDKDAYMAFFQANLKLVLFLAHENLPKANYMDLDDLNMEGTFALMSAMDEFDPELGNKFSTFAYPRISGAMSKAIHNFDRTIRIPRNPEAKLAGLHNREHELQKKLSRQPTDEEIAEYIGMTGDELAELQVMAQALGPLDSTLSYDTNGEAIILADVVPDDQVVDPEEETFQKLGVDDVGIIRQAIRDVLDALDDRERTVIEERYDLGGVGDGSFHADIAAKLGISRETVRRLDKELVAKLIPAVRHRIMKQGLVHIAEAEEAVAA